MVDKKLECIIYAYERIRTEFVNPPKNIPSSWDSYDTEFAWSRDDYRSAVGDNSRNTVTTRTTEVRAYFPKTRKDEFIAKGKGYLYNKLSEEDEFVFNGKEYKIKNDFPRGEIVDSETRLPLINVVGTLLRAGSFSEEFVFNQMKKYRRGCSLQHL